MKKNKDDDFVKEFTYRRMLNYLKVKNELEVATLKVKELTKEVCACERLLSDKDLEFVNSATLEILKPFNTQL